MTIAKITQWDSVAIVVFSGETDTLLSLVAWQLLHLLASGAIVVWLN